ncbi:MAG: glucuronate isomerase, partial [Clostridiales bacterium]|nr:glucuronate isomerase [Clostridiales bacterium]
AETMEILLGNPLYHWSHLELQRYFGYQGHLCADTAEEVWNLCNEQLQNKWTVRSLIKASNVTLICTTDDPIDSLEWHQKIAADDTFDVQVKPAWRPEKATVIDRPTYNDYIAKLSSVSGIEIHDFATLKAALEKRMDYFTENGCSVSDHSLDYIFYVPASDEEIDAIIARKLNGEDIVGTDVIKYKTALMLFLARQYHRRNWTMQIHYGCKRDNNAYMFEKIGADTGFDCIDNHTPAAQTADFLNALSVTDEIPRTILYSLNPNDDAVIGTIIGCFQDTTAAGKLQHGSAWWFNDHKVGMTNQMTSLANLGCLGNFIGMLTDSRSFLSYTRHEYFRRIMCSLIGGWVENGEYPNDQKALEKIVKGICYNNAVRYFGFDLKTVD